MRKPNNPNYLHRCRHHDYKRPARYLISLSKSEASDSFCRIDGTPASPHIELSQFGKLFETALTDWLLLYPEIDVPIYQIMPDHIHICVDVKAFLNNGLSRAIARLMGKTTASIRAAYCGANAVSAFARGFNDRIAYTQEQWERQKSYVADNPRRYLIKKLYPDLFYKRWILEIGGDAFVAQGNIMLLKKPDIQVVRFSRRYSETEFEAKKERWSECSRTGGVLVSPFIHPNEKAVREVALESGGAVIRVCENGFAERFCPQGEEFEFNGGSQLLLIAPLEHDSQKNKITYARAQYLNQIAEKIAETSWSVLESRIRPLR